MRLGTTDGPRLGVGDSGILGVEDGMGLDVGTGRALDAAVDVGLGVLDGVGLAAAVTVSLGSAGDKCSGGAVKVGELPAILPWVQPPAYRARNPANMTKKYKVALEEQSVAFIRLRERQPHGNGLAFQS
jgi:hypothetical protein